MDRDFGEFTGRNGKRMSKERILIVDDEKGMRQFLDKLLTDNGYDVSVAVEGEDALKKIEEQIPDLALVDFKMPGMNGLELLEKIKKTYPHITVIMMTAYGTVENAIKAMKMGAYDYLNKPFEINQILLVLEKAFEKKRLEEENILLRKQLSKKYNFEDIISANEKMHGIFGIIKKVALTKSTVLIQGETGTGKELIARALHNLSGRQEKQFIPVDCTVLSESLLESELFGHVKGAFTGATADRKGLFETADGGTVFLDEIGHISLKTQAKLLRVLQDGQIKRVGEAITHKVDVRLIAASNEKIEEAVKGGRFREDLYYRLNVVPLFIPPLREREEDIPLLSDHFIKKFNSLEMKNLQKVSPDTLRLLMEYEWPGNIRELENLIHRAVVMETGPVILPQDLPINIRQSLSAEKRDGVTRTKNFHKARKNAIESFEKRFLIEALKRNQGNVSKASQEVGVDRRNLHRKFKLYKINPTDYRQ